MTKLQVTIMALPLLDASHYLAYIENRIALCQRLENFETAIPARRVPLDTYDYISMRFLYYDEGLDSVSVNGAFIFINIRNY